VFTARYVLPTQRICVFCSGFQDSVYELDGPGSNPGGGQIFAHPSRPAPGVKLPWRGVKERVELYLAPPVGRHGLFWDEMYLFACIIFYENPFRANRRTCGS
jgi:hypothetical protein